MSPIAGLNALAKGKITASVGNRTPIIQPVACLVIILTSGNDLDVYINVKFFNGFSVGFLERGVR